MPTIDATVGGAASNSYELLSEAAIYFDNRLALPTPWQATGDDSKRALIMSTRVLDAMSIAHRVLRTIGEKNFYYTSRRWTGSPATSTQRLAWPRIGMYDANGNAIASDVIPQALKDAESELGGQLLMADTTLDNATIVGGITSVRAGSVSVSFKENIAAHVLPDAVLNLMPQSWFTDELVEGALMAQFDVVSERPCAYVDLW